MLCLTYFYTFPLQNSIKYNIILTFNDDELVKVLAATDRKKSTKANFVEFEYFITGQ